MSLNGSGRFLRRYDTRTSFESQQYEDDRESPKAVNFEPGSGAEFMYKAGWHNRDAYGNERTPPATTTRYDDYEEEESSYGMKFWLIIALGVVSFLLLALAIAMAVLFGTGVFIVNHGEQIASTPLPITGGIYDPVVNRSFTCQMLIENQANPAYVNQNSPEFIEASNIISRAANTMISQSTLASYKAVTAFISMNNIGDNLQVNFRVTITVPSRNSINAFVVRGILIKEISRFENSLNNVTVDRNSILVS